MNRLLVGLLFVGLALAHFSVAPKRNGYTVVPCATEEIFERKMNLEGLIANCTTRGSCDNAAYRDDMGSGNTPVVIKAAVHLMNSQFGEHPNGVGNEQVVTMMTRMNQAFGSYGIQFQYTIYSHNDAKYYCIPGYSGINQEWLNAINSMKNEYATDVGSAMNIFISCQTPSLQGTLFGIGTFPWDSAALTATGGLWLNSISVTTSAILEGDITAEHETGHCLGLWHTFHGSDEVLGCNLACEELPHNDIDPAANNLGDFCSDTPATPRNYACQDPTGNACNGNAWGTTDYTNYMGYGMDPQPCGNHFTTQQKYRMRCWVCDALSSWTISGC